jgi:serine/threonine protein kinase
MNSASQNQVGRDARLVQILDNYLAGLESHDAPSREELLAAHPDLADDLDACLASLDFLRRTSAKPMLAESAVLDPELEDWSRRVLGDYRIDREIGRGGMGIVYEAEQISLGRRVALKVLPFAAALDQRQLQRFKTEAQAAAGLHHTNIVPVHAVGCERGVHYYAMQYIDGRTLADVIAELRRSAGMDDSSDPSGQGRQAGRSTVAQASGGTERSTGNSEFFRLVARIGIEAAEALQHAHEQGVIHRDIKPANLLIDVRGRLWITDFGLARLRSDAGLTHSGDLVGTLRYMSPEQALGKRLLVDHRTDVYSLAATLYEWLTLRPPFSAGDRQELLQQIANDEPAALRRKSRPVPEELEIIVLKALCKEPQERYATAQELADDFRRFLQERPIRARRPTVAERTRKWMRRHTLLVRAVFGVTLAASAALAVSTALVWRARNEALEQRHIAEQQRALAQQREIVVQRHLYVADMQRAHWAWQSLDLRRMKRLLLRHAAGRDAEDMRGFEWHYLWSLAQADPGHADLSDEPRWFAEHPKPIDALAFSPKGHEIALGDATGLIRLVNASTGKTRVCLQDFAGPTNGCLQFSADGATLATHRTGATVQFWDTSTGRLRSSIDTGKGPLLSVALSPDGQLLATSAGSSPIALWDTATGVKCGVMEQEAEQSSALAFTPVGGLLVTLVDNRGLAVWDVVGRNPRRFLSRYQGGSTWGFSPDGKMLAFRGRDFSLSVWDIITGQMRATILRSDSGTTSIVFSPDGKTLAFNTLNGLVLGNVSTGQELLEFELPEVRLSCLAFSPDGEMLAAAGASADGKKGEVYVWTAPREHAPEPVE